MRTRRVKDGNTVIFDAKDLFQPHDEQTLLEMRGGPLSYETDGGVRFWQKHPYQWVAEEEVGLLLKSKAPEFRIATVDDLEDYYSYD